MTDVYYHLDRRTDLEAGRTIDLGPVGDGADASHATGPGDAGGADPLEALFPGGVTSHGRHYCTQDLYADDEHGLWDVSCELLFELVRGRRFPERPSRFQSVFAFRARRDLERFLDRHVDPPYTVWRVTADRSFTADMELVDAEDVADGVRRAETYWRGSTDRDRPLWEVLLEPPVDVLERLDTVPE